MASCKIATTDAERDQALGGPPRGTSGPGLAQQHRGPRGCHGPAQSHHRRCWSPARTSAKKYNLTLGTFGHAGDGNLHPTILADKNNPDEMARVHKAVDEIFEAALSFGGTLSGEHGIGIAKMKYLGNELGQERA